MLQALKLNSENQKKIGRIDSRLVIVIYFNYNNNVKKLSIIYKQSTVG